MLGPVGKINVGSEAERTTTRVFTKSGGLWSASLLEASMITPLNLECISGVAQLRDP